MKVGDICLIDGVSSVESLLLFKNLQSRFPTIVCPCHIPNTMEVEVIGDIGPKSVIIQIVDTGHKSVIMRKDLRVIRSKCGEGEEA